VYRHPLAILLVQPNNLSHSRFGFSASRAVGNAVFRNRAKRRFREVVRPLIPSLKPGWDCLFILRQDSAEADFANIDKVTHKLFSRAKLWQDEVLS
jgi:ribonuclease P protein component